MSVRKALLVLSAWVLLATCAMPVFAASPPSSESRPGDLIVLRAGKANAFTHVPRSQPLAEAPHTTAVPGATINVTYNGFTPAAQAAVQYAVDIWETQITSSVPIQVNANWTPLSASVLGSAGTSAWYRNFTGAPLTNTWYPAALANARNGTDLDPSRPDVTMNFNSTYSNWYMGTDGKTPADRYDLVTVVLHELGHGLGFSGSMTVSNGQGQWGLGSTSISPVMYDRFTDNSIGTDLTNTTAFPNPSTALATELQSGKLYFFGPNAVAANSGSRPKLYAPAIWEQGSSYSHLDESVFSAGNPNSLMTPILNWAESIHDLGNITRGIFKDLGWTTPAAGTLDLSFKDAPLIGLGAKVSNLAIQPDGKIVIGGEFTTVNGVGRNYITRLNADGSLDATFGPAAGPNGPVEALALQPDGKIVIGGQFYSVSGVSRYYIARLNADGSLDTTFAPPGGADSYVHAVALQADGKILMGGYFTMVNGVSRTRIARLNADGSLDTTFAPPGGVNGSVYSIAPQRDGKIVIGGEFSSVNGVSRPYLARLNTDGSLDTTFASNGGTNSRVEALMLQPDGKILMGGWFTTVNGVNRPYLARLNTDGSLDTTFISSSGTNDGVLGLAMQPDGQILIGGQFTTVDGVSRKGVARLNTNGSLDPSFAPNGGVDGLVYAIAVQADGKVIMGGNFSAVNTTSRFNIARLQANGSADTTFLARSNSRSDVYTLGVQSDGKILVGGRFFYANGGRRNHIARLNADGSLDSAFVSPLNNQHTIVSALAIQPDGKIIIGGQLWGINGTYWWNGIARLNADGSLDPTFAPILDLQVYAVALQPDGKIIIGGYFSGSSRGGIVRLNANGSLDSSFGPTNGANDRIKTVAVQPDGKIIIGGYFTTVNGVSRNKLARLNADGSLDPTFAPNGGADNIVESVVIQPDGKILIGGHFWSVNGVTRYCIARLNADGSLDTTFAPTGTTYSAVLALALQPDGKIVMGGLLARVNGVNRSRIARLEANGSLDMAFDPPSGGDGRTYALALQPDGNILMGGDFTIDHSVTRTSVARLLK